LPGRQGKNHPDLPLRIMVIQAVLFDADGVMILPHRFAEYLEREFALDPDIPHGFFEGPFLECLCGRADLRETVAPYLPDWGWPGSTDEFLARWFEAENAVDPRMIGAVRELKRKGLICGVATNQEKYRLEYMRSAMGWGKEFDAVFGSCELGCLKDDVRYYEQVTQRLGLPRQAILFWDDSAENVQTARAYGWRAERYQGYGSFRDALKQYLS
jgi:putative hydrolase of the HAD superfamily